MIKVIFKPCCGLSRTIPDGTQPGDTFTLVPCKLCGSTFYGKLHKDPETGALQVEELP